MYRRLIKLCFMRKNVLLDFSSETRMLIDLLHYLAFICEKREKKREMERRIIMQASENNNIIVNEASNENNDNNIASS